MTVAKIGLTKLHLNPSGWAGTELNIEDEVVLRLVREKEALSGGGADRRFS